MEARLVGVVRDREFERLRQERPDLANRFRRTVSGPADPAAERPLANGLAPAEPGSDPAQTLAEVLAAIQQTPGFGRFAASRTLAEIAGGLAGQPAAWVVFGPHSGTVVTLGSNGKARSAPVTPSIGDLQDALAQTLADRPTDAAYLSLRAFTLHHLIPHLPRSNQQGPLLVVPVGLAAWLPIQMCAEAIGTAIEIRPLLEHSKRQPRSRATRRPLVVHSHGRQGIDHKLTAALEETRAVAKVLRTRARVDPAVSPELVLDRLGRAPLIHLACHGAFNADPWTSSLRLGPGTLTVQDLVTKLSAVSSPPIFVALNACESAKSEVAAPEQSLGFPSVFLSYGARAVLATLWPVDDPRARDIAESFYRNWARAVSRRGVHGDHGCLRRNGRCPRPWTRSACMETATLRSPANWHEAYASTPRRRRPKQLSLGRNPARFLRAGAASPPGRSARRRTSRVAVAGVPARAGRDRILAAPPAATPNSVTGHLKPSAAAPATPAPASTMTAKRRWIRRYGRAASTTRRLITNSAPPNATAAAARCRLGSAAPANAPAATVRSSVA